MLDIGGILVQSIILYDWCRGSGESGKRKCSLVIKNHKSNGSRVKLLLRFRYFSISDCPLLWLSKSCIIIKIFAGINSIFILTVNPSGLNKSVRVKRFTVPLFLILYK